MNRLPGLIGLAFAGVVFTGSFLHEASASEANVVIVEDVYLAQSLNAGKQIGHFTFTVARNQVETQGAKKVKDQCAKVANQFLKQLPVTSYPEKVQYSLKEILQNSYEGNKPIPYSASIIGINQFGAKSPSEFTNIGRGIAQLESGQAYRFDLNVTGYEAEKPQYLLTGSAGSWKLDKDPIKMLKIKRKCIILMDSTTVNNAWQPTVNALVVRTAQSPSDNSIVCQRADYEFNPTAQFRSPPAPDLVIKLNVVIDP